MVWKFIRSLTKSTNRFPWSGHKATLLCAGTSSETEQSALFVCPARETTCFPYCVDLVHHFISTACISFQYLIVKALEHVQQASENPRPSLSFNCFASFGPSSLIVSTISVAPCQPPSHDPIELEVTLVSDVSTFEDLPFSGQSGHVRRFPEHYPGLAKDRAFQNTITFQMLDCKSSNMHSLLARSAVT
jgi:hypothetical protein